MLSLSANIGAKWNVVPNIEENKTGCEATAFILLDIGYNRLYNLVEIFHTNSGHQIPFHNDKIILKILHKLKFGSDKQLWCSVFSPLLMILLPCHLNNSY